MCAWCQTIKALNALNLMRTSASALACLPTDNFGKFDINRTPLAPPGIKVFKKLLRNAPRSPSSKVGMSVSHELLSLLQHLQNHATLMRNCQNGSQTKYACRTSADDLLRATLSDLQNLEVS
jgi:hypothetical protein